MNQISKLLLLGRVDPERLFGQLTAVVGRVVQLRHFRVETERCECHSCGCSYELSVGSAECPVCGDHVKALQADTEPRQLIEVALLQQTGGKIYLFGIERLTLGSCYCLSVAGNALIGPARQDVPQLIQDHSVNNIVTFLRAQAQNLKEFAAPHFQETARLELETLSIRTILTLFCHLKTFVVTGAALVVAEQFVEKVLGLLEQNTNSVTFSNLSKQLAVREDALSFAEIRPLVIYYLPGVICQSQGKVIENLFQQNFSMQISLQGSIYRVEYDYPAIILAEKSSLENALQFNYDVQFQNASRQLNIRALGQLVKMYSFQRISAELTNPYELQLFEKYKLPSDTYGQFCSGLVRFLGAELVDVVLAKTTNVAMLIYHRGVSRVEEYMREVRTW